MYTYSNKLILRRLLLLPASQYAYPRLSVEKQHAADVSILRIGFQRGPTLGVLQASTLKTAAFQVSKPCRLLRIQTL